MTPQQFNFVRWSGLVGAGVLLALPGFGVGEDVIGPLTVVLAFGLLAGFAAWYLACPMCKRLYVRPSPRFAAGGLDFNAPPCRRCRRGKSPAGLNLSPDRAAA